MIEKVAPRRCVALDVDVMVAFGDYGWPGNLRQLENALRTACALLDDNETSICQTTWHRICDSRRHRLPQPKTR
jgi:sigma-54 dependent transcriptional regulator, acetoin dehydrogenase operon transcriptional activator AcoR